MTKLVRSSLLTATALVAVSFLPHIAYAVCPASGGSTPNGSGGLQYNNNAFQNSTCELDNNDALTNYGSYDVSGTDAVVALGLDTALTNVGNLYSDTATALYVAGGMIEVTNHGAMISGGSSVIEIGGVNSYINILTNHNTGTIQSDSGASAISINDPSAYIDVLTNQGGIYGSIDTTAFIGTLSNQGIINGGSRAALINDSSGYISSLYNNIGLILSSGNEVIYNAGVILALDNSNGTISNTGSSSLYLIRNGNSGDIGVIRNNNGFIDAYGNTSAIYNNGVMPTIDNTNGTIRAQDGHAIYVDIDVLPIVSNVYNDNGLITSQNGFATYFIDADLGGLTLQGGTLSNTYTGSNTAAALATGTAQSGAIILDGIHLISMGTGSNSGLAFNATGSTELRLVNGTILDGGVRFSGANDTLVINDTSSIIGKTDFGQGQNTLILNGDFVSSASISNGSLLTGLGNGSLNVNASSNAIFDHLLSLGGSGQIIVDFGGKLTLRDGNIMGATHDLQNYGSIELGVGRTLQLGSINGSSDGSFVFNATSNNGQLETGVVNFVTSPANLKYQSLSVNYIDSGIALTPGSRSLIAMGNGTAVVPTGSVSDNSFLYDFRIDRDVVNDNELYLSLVQAVSTSNAANTPNNVRASNVLVNQLTGSSDPSLVRVQSSLANAPTRAAYNQAVEATLPTVDSGAATAAVGVAGQMFDLADGQMGLVTSGGVTGVASGDGNRGLHTWLQGFGAEINQGERNGFAGYDASTLGTAAGMDTRNFGDKTVLGVAFGYGKTNLSSKNANTTRTDIDSYQLMLYGTRDLKDDMFVTASATAGYNRNDQTRFNVGGVGGLNASADYNSWTAGFRSAVGRNYWMEKGRGLDNVRLTPTVFTEYVHFKGDGYTESGAGGANLTTGDVSQDILNFGTGVQAEKAVPLSNGDILKPEIRASVKYNVLDNDQVDTTTNFAGGGSGFTTSALDPANVTYTLGTGAKLASTNGWEFTANYDYTIKPDYNAHSATLRAEYKF